MQQRSNYWFLLISFVLVACGQPDTPLAKSPTATMAAQVSSTSTPIDGGQSSDLAMIEQLPRPAQSQAYDFAPNPMSSSINNSLILLMTQFMGDALMRLDLDPSITPNDLPIKAIDDYLTDTPIDQLIEHYQASFAATNWLAQPVQHIYPQDTTLIFEHEQTQLYIFIFTPTNTDQLFVSVKLVQMNAMWPSVELALVNDEDIFTAHDLYFPSDTTINNDLLNDPDSGELLKRDLLMPIRHLQSFWSGEITLEASLVAETKGSQSITYDLAKGMTERDDWQITYELLGIGENSELVLLRFIDNTIQVLLMNQLSEHEYLAQSSPNDWLLGIHVLTLHADEQLNLTLNPNFFSPIEHLEIPTQPDQQDYQFGTDRLIDTLVQGVQRDMATQAKIEAYINTHYPPESSCSSNITSTMRYSVFSSDSNLDQISAWHKQQLAEPNYWNALDLFNTFAFYGITTAQSYHGGSISLIERSRYNPQLSGSIAIIRESSTMRQPTRNFRGQEYYPNISIVWMVEPITNNLPLLPDAVVFNSVPHERFDGYVYGWLKSLSYQQYGNDCQEVTYLDGTKALVVDSSDLTLAPNFYDPILQSQGWQKIVMSAKHHRYIKTEQDGTIINTINLRWQLGSRITGDIIQVVMIDSSVTHR